MTAPPPAFTITLAIEERPRVRVEVENESEQKRLEDWVFAHEEYARLIAIACVLRDQDLAA